MVKKMAQNKLKNSLVVQGVKVGQSGEEGLVNKKYVDIIDASTRGDILHPGPSRSVDDTTASIDVSDDDILELIMEDDLCLYTSGENLRSELLSQGVQRGEKGGPLLLPARFSFTTDTSRGEQSLAVKTFRLLDIKGKVAEIVAEAGGRTAAKKIAAMIEDQLVEKDVLLRVTDVSGQRLEAIEQSAIDTQKPLLLFLHGTASSSQGSFSALWDHNSDGKDHVWRELRKVYNGNILAFEHRTLTHSPIDNAIHLLEQLPRNTRLHLVSHSRGGLIGELLCRGQLDGGLEPFSEKERNLFETDDFDAGVSDISGEVKQDYQRHREQLVRLNRLLKEKQPEVERFVRVACPARGTTLASGKLDIYLSGLLNMIGLIPALKASGVYDLIKAFLLAVIKTRTQPRQLPGLECMMPGSPFIAMLNSSPAETSAALAVIEGDIDPRGIFKKIALFFVDRFYESDHDLIVNTPSMDGGIRRKGSVPVLSDEGVDVNHFSYFNNIKTRRGVLDALTQSVEIPSGFFIRERKPAVIARSMPADRQSGEAPTLLLLPGLSGSHLGVENNRVWIDLFDLIRGRFSRLDIDEQRVRAQAVVGMAYGDLVDYMSQTHEVIPVPYDWRKSVVETASELAGIIDERLRNTHQPLRIIAHSMGGVVAHAMMAEHPDVWSRMCAREGSRVLMLGTPNRGSWSIMRIFAAQDKLIGKLAMADLRHNENQLLEIMARFPGLMSLLPLDQHDRTPPESLWRGFQGVLGRKWKRPDRQLLEQSQAEWSRIVAHQMDPDFVFYIAGHARVTPVSAEITPEGGKKSRIRFFSTARGDGQVPWNTGIPAGIQSWYVNAVHGDIPDHKQSFRGMLEILQAGTTHLLSSKPPVSRAEDVERELPAESKRQDFFPTEEMLSAALLGKSTTTQNFRESKTRPFSVSVVHGNLCFSENPIAVGHYVGDTIVSAEAALDKRLDNRLKERQQLGLYPGLLMSNLVLFNDADSSFPGVVVVGLGDVGDLTPAALLNSFRQALMQYVLIGKESNSFGDQPIRLCSLFIGSGAGGISLEDSIVAILRAVAQVNRLLAVKSRYKERQVEAIQFIELYEDLAVGALHVLTSVAESSEFHEQIHIEEELQQGEGGRRRVYYHEDVDWWQRLRIESMEEEGLKYTLLTGQARAESRFQKVQFQSIEPFFNTLTSDTRSDSGVGRVMFELLLPRDFKTFASGKQDLALVLDEASAVYPWEMLEYADQEGDSPLAIEAGLVRQLLSEAPPDTACRNHKALVVGDPLVTGGRFAPLPGAREEAILVHKLLDRNGYTGPEALIRSSGTEILTQLMTGKYEILHLAGHGVVDYILESGRDDKNNLKKHQAVSGMVIGEEHVLTAVELEQLPGTPTFVFINCCHLGDTAAGKEDQLDRPNLLAQSLAVKLIRQGVRAVIAAGWAVDDAAAATFARKFYELFLTGRAFGDAVKRARTAAYKLHPGSNTWGAYQCYGDPGFALKIEDPSTAESYQSKFVSLSEYISAIDNIYVDAMTATTSHVRMLRQRLGDLARELQGKGEWLRAAQLQQALGRAWGELDQFKAAIEAYTKALQCEQAEVFIRSVEQLANFESRYGVELYEQASRLHSEASRNKLSATEEKQLTARAAEMHKDAKQLVNTAIKRLDHLISVFNNTFERLALQGSAHKRRALVYRGNSRSLKKSLNDMSASYEAAYHWGLACKGDILAYPLSNWLAAEWLLHGGKISNKGTGVDFDALLASASSPTVVEKLNNENFWSAIQENDCRLLAALRNNTLGEHKQQIAESYLLIRQKASSARQFRSVIEHLLFLQIMTHQLVSEHIASDLKWLVRQLSINAG